MSSTQHTPGPWSVSPDCRVEIEVASVPIAFAHELPAESQDGERIANACLIAAAPDLLAQLVDCRALIRACGGDYLDMKTTKKKLAELDAVITKATKTNQ